MKESYKIINGIKVYHPDILDEHPDYDAHGLISLYNSENKHFWFIYRKDYIYNQLIKIISKESRVIEIGAGTGNVARHLLCNGYKNIAVGDMHMSGLKYARSYGITECYQFDLLRSPIENEFDVVCMFDVLEHISDSDQALSNVNKMLKNNGYVVLTLPAHSWLWNRDDKVAGHKKRYVKSDIEDELKKNNFEPIVVRYFFLFIVPLLLLRKFINPDSNKIVEPSEFKNEIKINKFINKALLFICNIEMKVSKYLPNWCGGSLFVIGKKK